MEKNSAIKTIRKILQDLSSKECKKKKYQIIKIKYPHRAGYAKTTKRDYMLIVLSKTSYIRDTYVLKPEFAINLGGNPTIGSVGVDEMCYTEKLTLNDYMEIIRFAHKERVAIFDTLLGRFESS